MLGNDTDNVWVLVLADAAPSLMALHQMIEARVALYQPLLGLAGRLDLVLAQLPSRSGDRAAPAPLTLAANHGPQVKAVATALYPPCKLVFACLSIAAFPLRSRTTHVEIERRSLVCCVVFVCRVNV